MKNHLIHSQEELHLDSQEQYQSLLRSIKWTSGFRLLFVTSTLAKGEEIISRVKKDVYKKHIHLLDIKEPIDNLYDLVAEIASEKAVDVLFIRGLQYSFDEYELTRKQQNIEGNVYDWQGIPKILDHLNQRREQFKDDFPICFVFMLSSSSDLNYFIRRTPDFFDWLSSLIVFPDEPTGSN